MWIKHGNRYIRIDYKNGEFYVDGSLVIGKITEVD